MISLSAQTFDIGGLLCLPWARVANPGFGQRRGSVVATLDGDIAVTDMGYTIKDHTFKVTWRNPTAGQVTILQYLVSHYSQVVLSMELGCFLVIPSFVQELNQLSLSLRIFARLDQ